MYCLLNKILVPSVNLGNENVFYVLDHIYLRCAKINILLLFIFLSTGSELLCHKVCIYIETLTIQKNTFLYKIISFLKSRYSCPNHKMQKI